MNVGDREINLREMDGDSLRVWLEIELNAAILRAEMAARSAPSLRLGPVELAEMQATGADLVAMLRAMEARKPTQEELRVTFAALRQADEVLACLALINADVVTAEDAPAFVVGLTEDERRAVVREQGRLNQVRERGRLVALAACNHIPPEVVTIRG